VSAEQAAVPLLSLRGLTKVYGAGDTAFQALAGVDLDIQAGEFVAIMGPSGSGKSTTARALCGLIRPSAGRVLLADKTLAPLLSQRDGADLRDIQYVFQNPDASLNPRRSVAEIKDELRAANADLAQRLVDLTGWGHARVHAELNRLSGVTSVPSATVDQLDRRRRQAETWLERLRRSRGGSGR
jgi:ABC-type dipeptide/oligopeptide/nickel transport system ATPase subunit